MLKTRATDADSPIAVGDPSPSATIDRSDLHDVLSNERRIELLELLYEERPRDIGTLAEEIAVAETGERPPPRNIRQSVYVTLHQSHLPKLDDLGIVDYDAREKTVDLEPCASVLFEHDAGSESEGADVEPFLGLVLVGLLATLASVAELPLLSALSPMAYAVATLVALLVGFAFRLGRERSRLDDVLRHRSS